MALMNTVLMGEQHGNRQDHLPDYPMALTMFSFAMQLTQVVSRIWMEPAILRSRSLQFYLLL